MATIKLLVGLSVIIIGVYLGATLIPVYYALYEFQDAIKSEATIQTYTVKPESDIQNTIYSRARQLELPLNKDQIKVERHGPSGNGSLTISAPYTVHLDIPGYPVDLHFEPSSENKSPFVL